MSAKIKQIQSMDIDLHYYRVGFDGVTEIIAHCERLYYNIYKGDHLHATVNDHSVSEIIYFPPEDK